MSEKLNEIINLNGVLIDILKEDVKSINRVEEFGYKMPDYLKNGLVDIQESKNTEEAVIKFGKIFDNLANDNNFELAVIIQQLMQRHGYFLTTESDYNNYASEISSSILDGSTLPEVFSSVFVPFFDEQINFYFSNFLDLLNQFNVRGWNEKFYNSLLKEVETVLNEKDFLKKVELIEKWIVDYSNPEMLYDNLGIDFKTPDPEKEAFATKFNEFKIVLQSVDLLLEKIIKETANIMENRK